MKKKLALISMLALASNAKALNINFQISDDAIEVKTISVVSLGAGSIVRHYFPKKKYAYSAIGFGAGAMTEIFYSMKNHTQFNPAFCLAGLSATFSIKF